MSHQRRKRRELKNPSCVVVRVVRAANLASRCEFQDQFENVAGHTQKGIEFCEKYSHFIKERCAIENEYASRLK